MKLEQDSKERAITNVSRWRHLGFLPSESLVEAIRLTTGSTALDQRERSFVEEVTEHFSQRS